MKTLFLVLVCISQFSFGQFKKIGEAEMSFKKIPQYTYRLNFYKITNSGYPGKEIELNLVQNVAILDGDAMLYPEIKADYGSMADVCPFVMIGYTKKLYPRAQNCSMPERPSAIFRDYYEPGRYVTMRIPKDRLTTKSKLVLGVYAAQINLSNGEKLKLKAAKIRTFNLSEMDDTGRNFIKFEIEIDGATIILDYILERYPN